MALNSQPAEGPNSSCGEHELIEAPHLKLFNGSPPRRGTSRCKRSGLAGRFDVSRWFARLAMSLLSQLIRPPRMFKRLSRMLVPGLMLPFVVVRGSGEVS